MDRDGTKDGYDLELTRAVADAVDIPVIASGGAGELEHLSEAIAQARADAVLCASIFHYGEYPVREAKEHLRAARHPGAALGLRSRASARLVLLSSVGCPVRLEPLAPCGAPARSRRRRRPCGRPCTMSKPAPQVTVSASPSRTWMRSLPFPPLTRVGRLAGLALDVRARHRPQVVVAVAAVGHVSTPRWAKMRSPPGPPFSVSSPLPPRTQSWPSPASTVSLPSPGAD